MDASSSRLLLSQAGHLWYRTSSGRLVPLKSDLPRWWVETYQSSKSPFPDRELLSTISGLKTTASSTPPTSETSCSGAPRMKSWPVHMAYLPKASLASFLASIRTLMSYLTKRCRGSTTWTTMSHVTWRWTQQGPKTGSCSGSPSTPPAHGGSTESGPTTTIGPCPAAESKESPAPRRRAARKASTTTLNSSSTASRGKRSLSGSSTRVSGRRKSSQPKAPPPS